MSNIYVLFLLLIVFTDLHAQNNSKYELEETDAPRILNSFKIADSYMSIAHYDSAQLWLNQIHERVSYLKPSLFSYFLASRQAEVYYYNNLQQLGMQEAKRALKIAQTLNDDILLSDAYNFCGLFYTNTERYKEAIIYFKKGIAISKKPPYPSRYLELSNPYHLYGNLAEAFEKNNQPDSSIFYARLSLINAQENNQSRGVVSALLSLANSYLKKEKSDSALVYFDRAQKETFVIKDYDLKLIAYSGMAMCASLENKKQDVIDLLDKGFNVLNKHHELNSFYQLLFLEQAVALYKKHSLYQQMATSLERKSQLQTSTNRKNNYQYRTVLMTALKNETRILNLEIEKAKHDGVLATTRLYIVGLVILLMIAGFSIYRYYSRQQLKIANLRNKISQDLHDEVGATLSGIALYSYIAKQQNENEDAEDVTNSLDIIDKNATDMVKKLSDIVWAVNPVHDSLDSLLQRLEDYSIEMASVKGMEVSILKEEQLDGIKLSMEQRKNIYLIIKEAVNNAIKYSECKQLKIAIALEGKEIVFNISDDGIGFDSIKTQRGNGLINMQSRAKELNGNVKIQSTLGEGTKINVICSIN